MGATTNSAVQIGQLSADWISASVAIVTAVVSLVFSLLSYFQAKAALKRADHALDIERSSSAVTHYLAAISESEKLYSDVRKAVAELYKMVASSDVDTAKLKRYIVEVGPDFIDKFQGLLFANADLLEPETREYLMTDASNAFFPLAESLTEYSGNRSLDSDRWTRPLRGVALSVNRYTGFLRAKLFERRGKLVALSPVGR